MKAFDQNKIGQFLRTLGPGILFASTAIGVSHLVQSTRAGASYGFALLVFIVAANVFKWPFFEYGSRYANVTGKSLIDGYHSMGKFILWGYFIITLGSMFFVTAAVAFVTAGFMENLFHFSHLLPLPWISTLLLLTFCFGILALGKFNVLDRLIKLIGCTLLVTTIIAFVSVLYQGPENTSRSFFDTNLIGISSLPFIIALMGWMPTAIDLSTWNSLWTIERIKDSGYKPTLKETLFEFNLGYWISGALSICFLTLGAFLLFGTGNELSNNSGAFAASIVKLYTQTIGKWSIVIIAPAAFSIMLGTTFGVLDGYARAVSKTTSLLFSMENKPGNYTLWLFITSLGGFLIILLFLGQLKMLVDIATTISFLIAPFVAIVNLKLVVGKSFSKEEKPPKWMLVLSYLGILFLIGFVGIYIWSWFN